MAAIHLHYKAHVGTTYKRALERFHQSRDGFVPYCLTILSLIDAFTKWLILSTVVEDARCANRAIMIRN